MERILQEVEKIASIKTNNNAEGTKFKLKQKI
jgi:hypothetical protein